MKKRLLSTLLILVMVFSALSVTAFADGNVVADVTADAAAKVVDANGTETYYATVEDAEDAADTDAGETVENLKLLEIRDVDDLQAFAAAVNDSNTFEGKTVKLMADIDLSSTDNWTPIGNDMNYFMGTFDGSNHTISNMTIDIESTGDVFAGLFGGIKKATVKNLTMTDVSITAVGAKVRAAAVAGIAHSNSENRTDATINFENITVDGCTINAEATSSSAMVGGIAGYCYPANMKNISVSDLIINGKTAGSNALYASAMAGYVCGQNISNGAGTRAYMTVEEFDLDNIEINAEAYTVLAGGYTGEPYYGYITFNNGDINGLKITVDAHEAFVGGLVGYFWRSDNGHTVNNVNITGINFDVTTDYLGETRIGGMVGTSQSVVGYKDCSVAGTITERCSDSENPVNYHAKVGGFVGRAYTWAQTYENCVADVDVTGSHVAGGFIGNHITNASYTNCEAKGDVTANIAGGFAGRLTENGFSTAVTFDGCSASGDVTGTNVAGGFIGSTKDHGWAAWNPEAGTPYGKTVTLKDCEATGAVTSGTDYCAGLVGEAVMAEDVQLILDDSTVYPIEPACYPEDNESIEVIEYVAQINDEKYLTLAEAITAANAVEGGATVELLTDVTLGEKLSITGDVTIEGEAVIARADDYTGTLFEVASGAELTLDGVTVDGAHPFVLDEAKFDAIMNGTASLNANKQDTYPVVVDANKPIAQDYMFINNGSIYLKDATIQNHSGMRFNSTQRVTGVDVMTFGADASVIMDNSVIKDCVSNNAGAIFNVSQDNVSIVMKNGSRITNNFGITSGAMIRLQGNNGTFEMESGSSIDNNYCMKDASAGGSGIILSHTTNTLNISDSSIEDNKGTTEYALDLRSASVLTMDGSEISGNNGGIRFKGTSTADLGDSVIGDNGDFNLVFFDNATNEIDSAVKIEGPVFVGSSGVTLTISNGHWDSFFDIYGGSKVIITGGTFTQELSVEDGSTLIISGGTFAQDVTAWCADGYAAIDNGNGTWTIGVDPAEAVCEMDGEYFLTIKDALWTLKSADTTVHKLTVLRDHEIDVNYHSYNYPILVNGFAVELDLNGKTITADWGKYNATTTRYDNALIAVCNGGKLTIVDSSEEKTGKIVNNDDYTDELNNTVAAQNRIFWIQNSVANKPVIVNIEGGTFVQNDNIHLLYIQGDKTTPAGGGVTVNITGGHFEQNAISENESYDFFNAYDGYKYTAEITGGTFNHDPGNYEIKLAEGYVASDSDGDGVYVVELDSAKTFVAKIGNDHYENIAAAVAAAQDGDTIELLADIAEDVTVVQKEGVDITLDGGEHTFSGTIYIEGQSRNNGEETLTIQNFVFSTTEATHDFISCNSTESAKRYAHNVTVQDCAFSAELEAGVENAVVGMRFRQCYDITVKNITAEGMHSLMWATGGDGMMIEEVMIADCLGGISFGTTKNVTVKDSVITAVEEGGHGLRFDGSAAGENTVENCVIEADIPVLIRKAEGSEYLLTITGADTVMTATAEGGCVVVTTGDTDTEGYPTEPDSTYASIDAGTYNVEPKAKYIADGYKAFDLQNGTWVVMPEDATVIVTFLSENKVVEEQVIPYAGTAASVRVTREGYDFDGWYLNGKLFDFDTAITENITLTAKWDRELVIPVGPSTYKIAIKADGVESSLKTAKKGETVTLTVEDGVEIVVLDEDGDEIELTYENGAYTFKMPGCDVTVKAVEKIVINPFVDVADDAYYTDAVLWAVQNGITNGTSAATFSPDMVCTRAQVVTFLWRAAGSPEPKSTEMPFTDVAADAYYYDAVLWAVENGITNGTSATTFSPDADCTRGQIVTFLWRSQGSENASGYNPFVDVANDAYYTEAVLWAVENGITNGTGANTFSPDADCTRGQIVTFLYRCLAE